MSNSVVRPIFADDKDIQDDWSSEKPAKPRTLAELKREVGVLRRAIRKERQRQQALREVTGLRMILADLKGY